MIDKAGVHKVTVAKLAHDGQERASKPEDLPDFIDIKGRHVIGSNKYHMWLNTRIVLQISLANKYNYSGWQKTDSIEYPGHEL